MLMAVGNVTVKVGAARKMLNTTWDIVHATVFDSKTTPLDGFDMYCHQGVWYAWTSDTVSQATKQRRHQIAGEYNRHVAA